RGTLAARWLDDGIESKPLPWYDYGLRIGFGGRPGKTLPYIAGYCHIQEEVSMLPVHFLDPRPGERILDMCAAPGNKSVQAAVHMRGRGLVLANDINHKRLGMVRRNIERIGLSNVMVSQWDGSSLPPGSGLYDRVLADVPCSCEGTTRKNSQLLWREQAGRTLTGLQAALLRKAVQRCRPGGRIVYATCTYSPDENEAIVDTVLREYPEQIRLRKMDLPGFTFAPGITGWRGREFLPELRHTMRAWPHVNDTGGFFIAVIDRIEGEPDRVAAAKARRKAAESETPPAPAHCSPAEKLEPLDPGDLLAIMERRFGIATSVFDGQVVYRPNRHCLWTVDADLPLPQRPEAYVLGMPFFYADMEFPRPTTATAIRYGAAATRNLVDLAPQEIARLLRRQEIELDAEQAAPIDGDGYVMLRHGGLVFGLGVYRGGEGGGGRLKPLLPRSWTTRLGIEAPPEEPLPWVRGGE
ncbi:MAG: RsmB/NOP family class I SAM-dependent RNA methyltransferase, partial [Acidobacteriota bacterium]